MFLRRFKIIRNLILKKFDKKFYKTIIKKEEKDKKMTNKKATDKQVKYMFIGFTIGTIIIFGFFIQGYFRNLPYNSGFFFGMLFGVLLTFAIILKAEIDNRKERKPLITEFLKDLNECVNTTQYNKLKKKWEKIQNESNKH